MEALEQMSTSLLHLVTWQHWPCCQNIKQGMLAKRSEMFKNINKIVPQGISGMYCRTVMCPTSLVCMRAVWVCQH